ncbi:MAG: G8 domain-containing protein, partial [Lentisphaerae bacterium]|nr:G8 domain-containing protein [Lentisphaerota bacterium]
MAIRPRSIWPHGLFGLVSGFLLLLMTVPSRAVTNTWITAGPSTNDWFVGTNWSGGVPAAGDDVVITNPTVVILLTNSAPSSEWLSSLTISNTATLKFSNWNTTLSATNVTIQSGAQMTVAAWPTNGSNSNNLYIACSNLTVQGGGAISATARGYPGVNGGTGLGPGGGVGNYGSGTYGGIGYGSGKSAYGDAAMPLEPGSAGGSANAGSTGGAGGGAIRIEATDNVTVNGTIVADGAQGSGAYGGSGAGGGVYISCAAIQGTGLVSAAGEGTGLSSSGNKGGGGGRIAVIYNTTNQAGIAPV